MSPYYTRDKFLPVVSLLPEATRLSLLTAQIRVRRASTVPGEWRDTIPPFGDRSTLKLTPVASSLCDTCFGTAKSACRT
jgi:hypothetical protein